MYIVLPAPAIARAEYHGASIPNHRNQCPRASIWLDQPASSIRWNPVARPAKSTRVEAIIRKNGIGLSTPATRPTANVRPELPHPSHGLSYRRKPDNRTRRKYNRGHGAKAGSIPEDLAPGL